MKKLFTLFAAMMAMIAINAAEVTFDFSKQNYANAQSFDGQTVTLAEGVTATFSKGTNKTVPAYYTTGTAIRLYGSNTMTITSTIGNMTAMTIQFSANSKAEEKLVANAGTWAVENTVGTWSGSTQELVFTYDATSGHARVKTITITLGAAPKVAAPKISATETTFAEKTKVTISGEEGTAIYYTTDGTAPDSTKTAYNAPFELTTTTTVKAIAYKGEEASSIASLTVTKLTKMTIAEAQKAAAGAIAQVSGTVYATSQVDALIGDGTGFILYHRDDTCKYAIGQKLTITGALSVYSGFNQFTATAEVVENGTETVTYPTITEMDGAAVDAWIKAQSIKYVKFQGKLTISGNYRNVTIEGATATGSLVRPTMDLSSLNEQDIVVEGFAVYATSSNKFFNVIPTSVKALASDKKEVKFTAASVEATSDPAINFDLTGANCSLSIPEWVQTGYNAFANKYIGGTYAINLAEDNTFELTVEGKKVELVEGELVVTYVDCKKDYSQNLYEFKLNAYTANATLYYSCDTIWTNIKPANNYMSEDNININATTAYNMASELKDGEVTNRAYNIFGYVVSISGKNYFVNDDPKATTGFEAYNATVTGNVAKGDYIRINGKMTNYKGNTPETSGTAKVEKWDIANLPVLRATPTVDTIKVTVAEALEIGNALDSMATTKDYYRVCGYAQTTYEYSTQYKNQTWYMNDTLEAIGKSDFQCYQCYVPSATDTVCKGAYVEIVGKITRFYKNGKFTIQISKGNAVLIERPTTGLWNNEATEPKATKIMENGRIIIRRGEKQFDIVGQAL